MHLRWGNDTAPGISRKRRGRGFHYFRPDGSLVRDSRTLDRIRSLAIPPAWGRVWICTDPLGHIQATGRDARKRKQYRYHPRWREERDAAKYDRMVAFAQALPRIRARVAADLRLRLLQRERVLAAIVRLLDVTLIRVGNEEYARDNKSYGLTTIRSSHVTIRGDAISLSFRGKGGKRVTADIHDRRVATVMQRCTSLPGEELFQYVDDGGELHNVGSDDVNAYLRDAGGGEFSAKDFRTWAGTVIAAHTLSGFDPQDAPAEERSRFQRAVIEASSQLGNTPAVCRRSYIHPSVFTAYSEGALTQLSFGARTAMAGDTKRIRPGLRAEERATLRLLKGKARTRNSPSRSK
jgi:DNA topoisomerase-1